MKKLLPLFLCYLFAIGSIFSQANRYPFTNNPTPSVKKAALGAEVLPSNNSSEHESVPASDFSFRTDPDVLVGTTVYDLQTNSSVGNRLTNHGDGTLSCVWIRGIDEPNFTDRGTGFNRFDGSEWGEDPSARLEADARTGWPNYARTASGVDFICNHTGTGNIHTIRRENEGDWVESEIPSNTGLEMLWPRMVVGGADGNTLHVIAITTPEGNGGEIYEGVNGHLLYFRSTDGGISWDKQDVILPGLDNTDFTTMRGDNYAIDASGDIVSIGYFGTFNDVRLAKSTDNGESWTTQIVFDFPLDRYTADDLYTVDDIPPVDTANVIANELAIFASDGAGSVLIDNDGLVHLAFGTYYVLDDAVDDNTSFFPISNNQGIRYWNENIEQDSLLLVGYELDYNGDNTVTYNGDVVGYGGSSFISSPTMGIDADNNIYLAYSAAVENTNDLNGDGDDEFLDPTTGIHYRHILATKTTDNGNSWSEPVDLINEATSSFEDLYILTEAAFPHMARLVDDKMHIIYQQDLQAGLGIYDDHAYEENSIAYLAVDISDLNVVATEEAINPESIGFTIAPNPANDVVRLAYELSETSNVSIHVQNIVGQHVRSFNLSAQQAGTYQKQLNIADLAQGIYLIQIQANNQIATRKLIVE